jgi:hypothetical protein
MKKDQTGESGGAPDPDPHRGKETGSGEFKGGQSNRAYYGGGQLGEKEVGENENAVSAEDPNEVG